MVDTPTDTLGRLNSSAPAPLATLARRARLVGERKPVTAVFADIVGSTTLAEEVDPEEWTAIINGAFDEMSRCIFAFEGTIAQVQGDALISFFGAPVAHEDDPERAVRAALAMIAVVDDYGAELKSSDGIDFQIRIGISTGLVLVGNVGSDLRYDYTAIGDTMNLAARLESAAPPGGIFIADRTERFVRPFFELEDVGALDLKGKSAAVQAYRVLGERSSPLPTRGVLGLESPMVGRDPQLQLLLGLVDTVRAGRGRAAVVIAEPGLGKSRLLAELKLALDQQDRGATSGVGQDRAMAWVTGQSLSYGARMPFHVINSLLLDVMGLNQVSSREETEAALTRFVADYLPDDDEVLGYLAHLMGFVDAPRPDGAVLPSGDYLSERLAAALIRTMRQVALQGPLVVVLEDVHWSDAASVDLIEALFTLLDDAPVLLVATARDEPDAVGWEVVTTARERAGRALTEIRLEPLDRLGSQILVANLLEIDSLPRTTRDLILEKAEGNPFFVEEVIRMLSEHDAIRIEDGHWRSTGTIADVTIPDTVHGLVLARIDRLPDEARRVLRLAACIDRRFSVPLLEDVARAGGIADGLGSALSRLEAASLLQLVGTDPEIEYRFSHALIQDAAYETVLRGERREWHRLVAEALLARYPDREAESADRLARHFELAGDAERAIHYLVIAADRAAARHAMFDARALYRQAGALLAEIAEADPELDRDRVQVALGLLASGVEMLMGEEAMTLIADGRVAAERVANEAGLSDLLFWEVMLRHAAGEQPDSSPELRVALERLGELGDDLGDSLQRSQVLARNGLFLWLNGDYHRSIEVLQQAGALSRERGDTIGAAMAEAYMAADYASLGEFDDANQRMQASRELAEGADALAMLDYHLAEAALAELRGDYRTSIRYATDCLEGSAELGALGCATVSGIVLGAAQLASGETQDAKVSLERSIEFAMQGYLAPQRLQGSVLLAAVEAMTGDLAKAQADFGAALSVLATLNSPYNEAQTRMARGMAMAYHPAGDPEEALSDLDAAIATFEALGARPILARTMRVRGMALAKLGRIDDADKSLQAAATLATEMGLLDQPWPHSAAELMASS